MTTELIEVPFHGDNLLLFERDGEPFVAIKPICERLGLDWKSQHRKLNDPENDWGIHLMTIPTAGGPQEMTCLTLMDFPLWLTSMSPSRVPDEDTRARLVLYRREAKRALWAHFFTGESQRSEAKQVEISELKAMLARSHAQLLASFPKWAKALNLYAGGMWWFAIARRVNLSWDAMAEERAMMIECGLIGPEALKETSKTGSLVERLQDMERENSYLQTIVKIRDRELKARLRSSVAQSAQKTAMERIMDGEADA